MQIDFHFLKQILTEPETGSRFPTLWTPSWKIDMFTYDVITSPPIVRLIRNLASRCKMTCRWLHIGQNRNPKYNSNTAAVRFPKPEVVFITAIDWDISSKFGRTMQIDIHLLKQIPSLNLNPEVDFRLYGRHLEKSIWRHNSATVRPIRPTMKSGRHI